MPALLLLLPIVLRGRVRAAAGFLVGVALALALPFLTTGLPKGKQMLGEWRAQVQAPAHVGQPQGSRLLDQSVPGALRRLLVKAPAFDDHAPNVVAREPTAFAAVSRAASFALLLTYTLVLTLAPARAAPLALLLDLALGCCALLQVAGLHLKTRFVVLLLPAWLAATLAWNARERAPRVLLAVAGALFLGSQPALVGRAASNWLLGSSSMTVGTLLLALVLIRQRFAVRPPPSVAPAVVPAAGTTA